MISDWRGERWIGRPSFSQRAGAPLRAALIVLALTAVTSAFVVFVRPLGAPLNWFSNLRLWAIYFGVFTVIIAFGSLFGPRKGLAIIIGLWGAAIALTVWFMALPVLSVFGIVMIVPVR